LEEIMLSAKSTDAEVLELVRSAITEVLQNGMMALPTDELSVQTSLDGLGIDSVTALEIGACIEDRAGIVLPEAVLGQSRRVGDLLAAVRAGLAESTLGAE